MDATITRHADLPHRSRPLALPALAGSIVLVAAVSAIGGLVTGAETGGWYRTLEKPPFNPPDWVFAPVWTVLYGVIALVGWQIWRTPVHDGREAALRRRALVAFGLQLALNLGWSLIFFGAQRIGWAMAEIVVLWLAILWTILAARPVIGRAAWWLAPYLLWVSYAALLNASILVLNA